MKLVCLSVSVDAWTEQAQRERDEAAVAEATPPRSDNEDNGRGSPIRCTPSPRQPDLRSFFLTDRQISKSLDFEAAELISPVGEFPVGELKPGGGILGNKLINLAVMQFQYLSCSIFS